MHDSRKVFLLDEEPRCILATYEEGENASRTEFKTWDQDIQVDDFIVVPSGTRHDMTVVKVVKVDVEPNLESSHKMDWVVCKIDRAAFEDTTQREATFLNAARKAEKLRKKQQMREDFLRDVDPKAMSTAIEHQPTE